MQVEQTLSDTGTATDAGSRAGRWCLIEAFFIFGLFFLYAGSPPPDVNEAHYLTKAKHYWDPTWCGDDLFLNSADPHVGFYWVFGWLTLYGSLTAVAWLGRVICWGLLALAWQRFSWSLLPRRLWSIASAALFIVLLEHCHLAGEWVVGGVEAKTAAWALVLFGMRSIVLGQWRAVWLWLGAASALHVLVGGWSVVAAGICWLLAGKERMRLRRMLPALLFGACLASFGLAPALVLERGADLAIVDQAHEIYVYGRLAHHLVFHQFALQRVLSYGAMLVVWIGLCWYLRNSRRWWLINGFAAGSLLIALVGVAIDLATASNPQWGARLLRFYWFRLSDVAVAIMVATGLVLAVQQIDPRRGKLARVAWCLLLVVPGAVLGWHFLSVQRDFRPGAVRQTRPVPHKDAQRMQQRYRAWVDVCQWVRHRTPPDARFLTPRNQQTFKWYAQRAEVACWKDIPQDAESIVRWWRLMHEIYTPEVSVRGLGSWSDEQLQAIAQEHDVGYILVDRARTNRRLGLYRVYPTMLNRNSQFEVYKVFRK